MGWGTKEERTVPLFPIRTASGAMVFGTDPSDGSRASQSSLQP